jgi:hypothetical protein
VSNVFTFEKYEDACIEKILQIGDTLKIYTESYLIMFILIKVALVTCLRQDKLWDTFHSQESFTIRED